MAQSQATQPAGRLIQLFPDVKPTCFVCPHHRDVDDADVEVAVLSSDATRTAGLRSWCVLWNQPIDSETYEASNCPEFSVDREKVEARGR